MADEKPFDLRDQLAIAAMQALIESEVGEYRLAQRYISDRKDANLDDYQLDKMERIALAAYKMADAMRKARLKAFG